MSEKVFTGSSVNEMFKNGAAIVIFVFKQRTTEKDQTATVVVS